MRTFKLLALAPILFALPVAAATNDISVQMNRVDESGIGQSIGAVVISNVAHGVVFTPALTGLTPGEHGFHVHENSSCEPGLDEDGNQAAAMAAGGHYDPEGTDKHDSPLGDEGHKGDLPVLVADSSGRASMQVAAARLSMVDLHNRTLMIHVGGDNYSDHPQPLGGGGARFACGLIRP